MTKITDETRKEALGWVETQLNYYLFQVRDNWTARRYINKRSWIRYMMSEVRKLRTLRSALEPKAVTREQIDTLWESTCDCFEYYYRSHKEDFEKALLEWLKALGVEEVSDDDT